MNLSTFRKQLEDKYLGNTYIFFDNDGTEYVIAVTDIRRVQYSFYIRYVTQAGRVDHLDYRYFDQRIEHI